MHAATRVSLGFALSPARGLMAAISCGNFGIVSCRPQTLSRLSALPSPSLFSPRLVVIVTLMRCKIDALSPSFVPSRALNCRGTRVSAYKTSADRKPISTAFISSHSLCDFDSPTIS